MTPCTLQLSSGIRYFDEYLGFVLLALSAWFTLAASLLKILLVSISKAANCRCVDIDIYRSIGTDAWGGMWSSLEVSLDVVAACLPVIAPGLLKMARQGSFSWSHVRSSLLRSARNSTVDAGFHGLNQGAGDRSMERMISSEQGRKSEDKPRLDKTLAPPPKLEGDNHEDLELGHRPAGTGVFGTV